MRINPRTLSFSRRAMSPPTNCPPAAPGTATKPEGRQFINFWIMTSLANYLRTTLHFLTCQLEFSVNVLHRSIDCVRVLIRGFEYAEFLKG